MLVNIADVLVEGYMRSKATNQHLFSTRSAGSTQTQMMPTMTPALSPIVLHTLWGDVGVTFSHDMVINYPKQEPYNHNATVFTFATPEGKPLALPTCGCILVRGGKGADGAPACRPYTPIVQTTDGA